MFPHKNTTITNRIIALNKCIEMYDKQGELTNNDGSYVKGIDYASLGKAVKEQVLGLNTILEAKKEMDVTRNKINSLKKNSTKSNTQ